MKKVIAITLFFSFAANADLTYQRGQEGHPTKTELDLSRKCFDEMTFIGCGHPREDQEFFQNCHRDHKEDLSITCRTFFEELYGK